MKLTSAAFNHNYLIPKRYSCDGKNINPPLEISEVPEQTKSLVLLVYDPDAPAGLFTHWILYNLSPTIQEIAENSIPEGAIRGRNGVGNLGYVGPCPPKDVEPLIHRYVFTLFALDIIGDMQVGLTKESLEEIMIGQIIEKTELIGLYTRK